MFCGSKLDQILHCTSFGPQQQTCQVGSRSDVRFNIFGGHTNRFTLRYSYMHNELLLNIPELMIRFESTGHFVHYMLVILQSYCNTEFIFKSLYATIVYKSVHYLQVERVLTVINYVSYYLQLNNEKNTLHTFLYQAEHVQSFQSSTGLIQHFKIDSGKKQHHANINNINYIFNKFFFKILFKHTHKCCMLIVLVVQCNTG